MTKTHSNQNPEFIQTNDPLALAALILAALNRPGRTIIELSSPPSPLRRGARGEVSPRIITPGGRA